jgi:SAM-dependent methyltransferase
MTEPCPVCRGEDVRAVAPYRDVSPAFGGMERAVCGACRMVYASPMPHTEALAAYNASYFASAHGGAPENHLAIAFHSAINRLRLAHVEGYLAANSVDVRRVLEVGAGGGHFARHWLAHHPDTAYYAIESDRSQHASLESLGVKVHEAPATFEREAPCDLVVISHVLEHTSDPAGFLEVMTSRLRSRGVIFIEVPCQDWQHKGQDEPHLLFFDKDPLGALLTSVGFVGLQLSYHGEELSALRSRSLLDRVANAVRSRLMARGVIAPFARVAAGLEVIEELVERAVVKPFQGHVEQEEPARWLRCVARKA